MYIAIMIKLVKEKYHMKNINPDMIFGIIKNINQYNQINKPFIL